MPLLGQLTLWLALLLGVWGTVIGFAGARHDRTDLHESARRTTLALAGVLVTGVVALVVAVMRRDFQLAFVAAHADLTLDAPDIPGVVLDGIGGRLLVGAAALALCLAAARLSTPGGHARALSYATGFACGAAAAVVAVVLVAANPFALLSYRPLDGQGLSPRLHGAGAQLAALLPCLAYAAAAVPLAWLLAGWRAASGDEGWRRATRAWVLIVWVLLTAELGLALRSALAESAGSAWLAAMLIRPAVPLWLAFGLLLHLGRRPGLRPATLVAYAGAVLVVASVVATRFGISAPLRLRPGESAPVGRYAFTYVSSSVYPAHHQIITQALIEARRDGRTLGRRGAVRRQQLDAFGRERFDPTVAPATWSTLLASVYVRWTADSAAGGAAEFVVATVPLAGWLCAGLWLLGLGGLAALVTGRGRA